VDALSALSPILRASCWIRARWSGPANDSVGTEGSSLLEQRCAEIHVTKVLWPDFRRRNLFEAIIDFQSRERRYGAVEAPEKEDREMFVEAEDGS